MLKGNACLQGETTERAKEKMEESKKKLKHTGEKAKVRSHHLRHLLRRYEHQGCAFSQAVYSCVFTSVFG